MLNKLRILTILSTLFSVAFGLGVTSTISNKISSKTTVVYTSENTINNHDANHSTDYDWNILSVSDFSSSEPITGGSTVSDMVYYYLNEDMTLENYDMSISGYVTLCPNGYTLTGTVNDSDNGSDNDNNNDKTVLSNSEIVAIAILCILILDIIGLLMFLIFSLVRSKKCKKIVSK